MCGGGNWGGGQPGQKIETILLPQVMSGERRSVYRHKRLVVAADATGLASRLFPGDEAGGPGGLLVCWEETSLASTCNAFISLARIGHIAQKKRQHHLRQHLCPQKPPSTSLGLHNKKLTKLMFHSLLASHSLPHAALEELGLCLIHRHPPQHAACSTSLGLGYSQAYPSARGASGLI